MKKPRVRFCWECGSKLRGNHYVEKVVDQHPRILHKQCAKLIEQGLRYLIVDESELPK